jgi:hypothetical protein
MDKTIRRVTSAEEQQAETYRYWQSRTSVERMEAIAEIVKDAYYSKGIDLDAQRPERTLVRVQRARS